ncbi:MAG: energy-coupling factor ABC transporter ATP-binding protein [Betaproteobacteria bacterium]|nr:energy-coupling factor ABC transporter ATP-binding protein [Betaproteobacteria bacterium]
MSAPLLRVAGLRKDFGSRRLLDIEHLDIEAGGAYVLTGANGSGKTTLMRILAGLEPAQVRAFEFGGAPVALAPYPEALRRAIVYVHQQPYVFHTSLRHNIEYGLRCRSVPAAERARRVAAAIAWAGLGGRVATPPAKMSGGEKQRAALARARALQPELLLLDEPTASLDRDGRAQTLALLAQLRDERRSVLVACHDQEVITLEGFRRLHLEDGRIAPQSG